MCGIAGLLTSSQLNKQECLDFIDALAHRGPDGRGTYFDPDCSLFLGHRRLKILDPSELGKQPMASPSGRYQIVFNGEIYNFLEIREELEKKGYQFRSQSDTEVILAAYEEWGEVCQLKFNGMWAFAVWDSAEKKLFLSRDRFGVKPLYIAYKEAYFAFSSEIKAFSSFMPLSFDEQRVADTIEDPLILEPNAETLFQGIYKVLPGHSLTVDQTFRPLIKTWWNTLDHLHPDLGTWDQQVNTFRSLFFDACSLRMRSDVSIGTALSGGLDSSSILCSIFQMSQSSHIRWPESWQKSFTAVFPNSSHSELEYAKIASQKTGAHAFYYTISPSDLMGRLEDTLYAIEDIFDPPIGPWLLYREYRKQGVTISIDGHGADELLAGYHHQAERAFVETLFPFPRLKRLATLWPMMQQMYAVSSEGSAGNILQNLLKSTVQALVPEKTSLVYRLLKKAYWGRSLDRQGYGRYGWLRLEPSCVNKALERAQASHSFQKLSLLNKLLYLDFHIRTLPSILRNFDHCSMAHGVEIRAPFMDWRIATYVFSLPSEAKIGSLGSKHLLRSAMQGILPEEIRLRKSKIGFASPLNQWIATSLKEYILDIVQSQSFRESSIWNGPRIASEAEAFVASGHYLGLRKVWEFLLADRLMVQFRKRAPVER